MKTKNTPRQLKTTVSKALREKTRKDYQDTISTLTYRVSIFSLFASLIVLIPIIKICDNYESTHRLFKDLYRVG